MREKAIHYGLNLPCGRRRTITACNTSGSVRATARYEDITCKRCIALLNEDDIGGFRAERHPNGVPKFGEGMKIRMSRRKLPASILSFRNTTIPLGKPLGGLNTEGGYSYFTVKALG